MTEAEIRARAALAESAFRRELDRIRGTRMRHLVSNLRYIAADVRRGEYHRGPLFRGIVEELEALGFDMSGVDTGTRSPSTSVLEAADNAVHDLSTLYSKTFSHDPESTEQWRIYRIVDKADDLIRAIGDDAFKIGTRELSLHDAVSAYVADEPYDESERPWNADGADWSAGILYEMTALGAPDKVTWRFCEPTRELPKRVIFSPPATVAFWGDGTKTVAKCSKDDEFSEYVGLLVCIAKRKLKVPRRGTFEDAMARLLKRADRPRKAKAVTK